MKMTDQEIIQKCIEALPKLQEKYKYGNINELYDFSNAKIKKVGTIEYVTNIYSSKYKKYFNRNYQSIVKNHCTYTKFTKIPDEIIIQNCINALPKLQEKYKHGDINELYDFSNAKIENVVRKKYITNIYSNKYKEYFYQEYYAITKYHCIYQKFTRIVDEIIIKKCIKHLSDDKYDFSNADVERDDKIYINNIYCKKCNKYINSKNYYSLLNGEDRICNCNLNNGKCILYLIEFKSEFENFIKMGMTNDLRQRINIFGDKYYDIGVVKTIKFDEYNQMAHAERVFHKKYKPLYQYIPKNKFGGSTECYTMDLLNDSEVINFFKLNSLIESHS